MTKKKQQHEADRPEIARLDLREVRQLAGWPMHKLAVVANVCPSTVRLFEANPDAVVDPVKRARLKKVYVNLASIVAS
jgi:hypothetical protein